MAAGAGADVLDASEGRVGDHALLTAAAAGGAGVHAGAGLRAGAVALGALLIADEVDLLLAAQRGLLEGEGQVVAQIVAGNGAIAARGAAAAGEERGKDVLKAAEAAAKAAEIAIPAAAKAALRAVMSELVVLSALLGIRQHLIGLVDLLEALLRFFVARVDIGMVLLRELSIGALDGRFIRAPVHAENLVIISLCHMSTLL